MSEWFEWEIDGQAQDNYRTKWRLENRFKTQRFPIRKITICYLAYKFINPVFWRIYSKGSSAWNAKRDSSKDKSRKL